MSSSRFEGFYKALEERMVTNRYRRLKSFDLDEDLAYLIQDGVKLLNVCSNDYLNLSRHPHVTKGVTDACMHQGAMQ